MRAEANVFRKLLPESVQRVTVMQRWHATPHQPERFAAAKSGFTGKQRIKINTSATVVVKYQFVITYL